MNDIQRKLLSYVVAGGIMVTPAISNGETGYKHGSFITTSNEENYNQYVVKEGDNASVISRKICAFFNQEISNKFWPVIAFYNNYPRVIHKGDIIVFPKTYEQLVEVNNQLQEMGWTKRYVERNNIYHHQKKKRITLQTIGSLLYEIYGDSVCIDEDFVRKYLRLHELNNKYDIGDTDELSVDDLFRLTEWIPSLEEIEDNLENNYQKIKK